MNVLRVLITVFFQWFLRLWSGGNCADSGRGALKCVYWSKTVTTLVTCEQVYCHGEGFYHFCLIYNPQGHKQSISNFDVKHYCHCLILKKKFSVHNIHETHGLGILNFALICADSSPALKRKVHLCTCQTVVTLHVFQFSADNISFFDWLNTNNLIFRYREIITVTLKIHTARNITSITIKRHTNLWTVH